MREASTIRWIYPHRNRVRLQDDGGDDESTLRSSIPKEPTSPFHEPHKWLEARLGVCVL